MIEDLLKLEKESRREISGLDSLERLDDFRVHTLGKKGALTQILKQLGSVDPEERPKIGQMANDIKERLSAQLQSRKAALENARLEASLATETEDITQPGPGHAHGKEHPVYKTMRDVEAILGQLGFSVKTGPDVETDYYNFEALNIADDHPARDMHDTFYVHTGHLLRTHTSPVQIHTMKNQASPLKIICPGKVYRCDADVSHSPVFHQIEGLYVDKKVTLGHLKGTLEYFLRALFGENKKLRFRSSYFPFTEPSVEVDVACVKCDGVGCNVCQRTGWMEILGAGMVQRNVFRAVGWDPDEVSGFAFGLGIERIAMLNYAIPDIRLFYENDLRFLEQF